MNVLAADRGEGISGRRSLLAAHVYREARQRRHRIAPPHDRSVPVWFLPPAGSPIRTTWAAAGTWTSSAPLPVRQVLGRSVGEHATGFAVCVIGAGRGGYPPSVVPQAVALTAKDGRSQARCRRDQFVSGAVRASGRVLVIPDVTISRPFGGHASRLSVG